MEKYYTFHQIHNLSAAIKVRLLMQGLVEYHKEIAEYFNDRGVSVIFLFRRNLLRRMVSVLANSYDRYAKLLNGTHKSHVHSHEEVSLAPFSSQQNSIHAYRKALIIWLIYCRLILFPNINQLSMQHRCWWIWSSWKSRSWRHWSFSAAQGILFYIMKIS